jgi:hypothetical protein
LSDPVYEKYVKIAKASFYVSLITVTACVLTAFWNWKQHFERTVLTQEMTELRMRIEKIEGTR